MGHVEDTVEISGHHLTPLFWLQFVKHRVARDSSIIYKYIARPVGCFYLRDTSLACVIVRHIPFKRGNARSFAERVRRFNITGIGCCNLIASLLKTDCNGFTNPASAAGDNGASFRHEGSPDIRFFCKKIFSVYTLSTHMATPIPPPIHNVARPLDFSERRNS